MKLAKELIIDSNIDNLTDGIDMKEKEEIALKKDGINKDVLKILGESLVQL